MRRMTGAGSRCDLKKVVEVMIASTLRSRDKKVRNADCQVIGQKQGRSRAQVGGYHRHEQI